MRTKFFGHGLLALLASILLSACFYTPDQRAWSDIEYRPKTIQLKLVNADNLNDTEFAEAREIFIQKLSDIQILVTETAATKLNVKIVTYNQQSLATSVVRVGIEAGIALPAAHFTTNAFNLEGSLVMEDGRTLEFTELPETKESGRTFRYLLERMARQVVGDVFTSKGLYKAHELGYDKVSTNK